MLPSKGFFSSINCPHYDSGTCERPHCHFRHVKKEKSEKVDDSSDNVLTKENSGKSDDVLLKHLVTEAVKQVLSHSEVREKAEGSPLNTTAIVTDVVNKLQPSISSVKRDVTMAPVETATTSTFLSAPSYKPTPISELKKRHIPVMYAPEKPSSSVRKFKKTPCGREKLQYIPKLPNGLQSSATVYKPTEKNYKGMEYTPDGETCGHAYVPSKICERSDVNDITPSVADNNKETNMTVSITESSKELISPAGIMDQEQDSSKHNSSNSFHALANVNEITQSNCDKHKTLSSTEEYYGIENKIVEQSTLQTKEIKSVSQTDTPCNNEESTSIVLRQNDIEYQVIPVNNNECSIDSKCADDLSLEALKSNEAEEQGDSSKANLLSKFDKDGIHKGNSHKHCTKQKDSHKTDKNQKDYHKTDKNQKDHKTDKNQKDYHKTDSHKKDHHKSSNHKSEHRRREHKSGHHRSKSSKNDRHRSKQHKRDHNIGSHRTSINNKSNQRDSKRHLHKNDVETKEKSPGINCQNKKVNNYDRNHSIKKSHSSGKRKHSTSDEDLSNSSGPVEIIPLNDPILILSSPETSDLELEQASENIKLKPQVKKRISHVTSDAPKPHVADKTEPINPAKVLCERWQKARQAIQKCAPPGKVKISSVPNVSSILNARKEILKVTTHQKSKDEIENPVLKQVQRIAHLPLLVNSRPIIEPFQDTKIPVSIRQTFLNSIYDEYTKFYDEETAKNKALVLEKEVAGRSKSTPTYRNAMAVARMRVRRNEGDLTEATTAPETLTSASIPDFTYGLTLYECMSKYLLTNSELEENGYPMELPNKPGCAFINPDYIYRPKIVQPANSDERVCLNCKKSYYVDDCGVPTTQNDCHYHWGKTFKCKVPGMWGTLYICCKREIHSAPCTTNKYHICELSKDDCLEGFVKTRPNNKLLSDMHAGVFAVDCEMCYTVRGSEITRVTVIDLNGKACFDKMIKPDFPILDYCTRFSGVTESDLVGITDRLPDIQKMLLKFINDKTILIGHSLDNDLRVLKILHNNVVDTSVVFPHKMGPPRKSALRYLAQEFLNVKIQDKETGHDSTEDAKACLDLMMMKVKEDAKSRKPRVIVSLNST